MRTFFLPGTSLPVNTAKSRLPGGFSPSNPVSLKNLSVVLPSYLRVCVLLLAMLGFAACGGEERPPFALWTFRAGMPLSVLDSIALHSQKERLTCVRSYGSFKSCTVQTLGSFGLVQAVVDSSGYAVLVAYKPDVEMIHSYGDMDMGLLNEARRIRAVWNQIAEPHPDPKIRPPARAESWLSQNGRWSARLVWQKDGYPSEFRVADERAMRAFGILADKAEADSMAQLAIAPIAAAVEPSDPQVFIDLMSLELKRLADSQVGYHDGHRDYADDLKSLKFVPRSKIQIRIGSADPFGFWARATHELLPDYSCRIFLGEPPGAPTQLGPSEGQPTCSAS